ncbi:MAG TPA: type II secretion system F family protein [Vulgatibacter sp.]|nr:type II secretion system F family protein [Vulgatibacter sp.]
MATLGIWTSILLGMGAVFCAVLGAAGWWRGDLVAELSRFEGPLAAKIRGAARAHLGPSTRKRIPSAWLEWLRLRIVRAGDPADLLPEELIWLSALGAAAGIATGAVASAALGSPLPLLPCTALGGALPHLRLREAIRRRQARIVRELPFALDLLSLSVEAGLDFAGALGKVVEKGRPGPLRDELGLVLRRLRMGRTREEALLEAIPRVDLPVVNSVLTSLVQADRMGTSLGKTLRILAGQLRAERTQRAEKLAGEAPVKMLVPLIAFIFPTVFLVLFGPIVFAMTFGGAGG